ncbi:MAG: nickel pincer cofactor biosynthesis protein LarC [Verrucomicrobia bacterium]|jgi:hypothetical protein|nr:nickel pincer cofactor biosynthesis protein LarC [Verrucomicrobiota bacterium]OQC67862.1 MAG: hypothetical protein BWX48_00439 [Verrucomicrobia bacterium ADurb.Bin006]MDI9382149.1 nickel pincer cofactor biosynthesis protein LarC [Verrucomicrobiota bacterium]NMD20542.1 nickel pincer cofactor biosynthesis protein LarC [Verrucomicrobiota bacterium]HNV00468.1 nickel pincer cofactor biosynthesis protein LarC [Verrucomicrobiota bacterium]
MKAVYFDPFSGVSGDMILGALLDLGVEIGSLRKDLARLPLGGYHLHATRRTKAGICGTKFDVHLGEAQEHSHAAGDEGHHHEPQTAPDAQSGMHKGHTHPHPGHSQPSIPDRCHVHSGPHHGEAEVRDFRSIATMVSGSSLPGPVRDRALGVFRRIAEAEGKIHGCPPESVHFHEVGAVDSIVDVVGGCLALEALGRPRVFAAPLIEGTGWVRCAHGQFPVPAPATLEILAARGLTLRQCEEPQEMVTPTGAAFLAEFAEAFGPMPAMRLERIGYGLGMHDMRTRPNVLRAVLGELESEPGAPVLPHDWEGDHVGCLETNLDDANPEVLGHFVDRALAAGALDVFYGSVQMKKNRPGVVLTVLCPVAECDRFSELILCETTAFGVRRTVLERRKLRREFLSVDTPVGRIKVKVGRLDGRIVQVAPEYESCRAVAAERGMPLQAVYTAAVRAVPASSGDSR